MISVLTLSQVARLHADVRQGGQLCNSRFALAVELLLLLAGHDAALHHERAKVAHRVLRVCLDRRLARAVRVSLVLIGCNKEEC